MIEKIMRAVKSSNKKRGRNITIGAVVGMLLSCSAVMGKDVAVLEITKDGDKIIFKDKNGDLFTPGKKKDPYPNNKWDGNTYINNSAISGEAATFGDNGIGIKLSGELTGNLINNGIITGSGSSFGYGIRIISLTGDITNNGAITGSSSGIYIDSSLTGNLTNNGVITGYDYGSGSDSGSGIYIDSSLTENLTNNGVITGYSSGSGSSSGSGIYIDSSLTGNLTNNGLIIGSSSSSGYGIYIFIFNRKSNK